jgi:uncharacterized protein YndB with AHSA1/START domain
MGMQGSRTVRVLAPPERVWSLVSDVTRMGEWSPETFSAEWIDGASGPAAGARFKGRNQRDGKGPKWSTRCTVTECEPGREFTFVVGKADKPVTRWSYRLAPSDGGTDVTESFESIRYGFFWKLLAPEEKRQPQLERGLERTLANLKTRAEHPAA